MSVALAAVAAALLVWPGPGVGPVAARRPRPTPSSLRRRWLLPGVLGLTLAVALGGWLGVGVGSAAAGVAWRRLGSGGRGAGSAEGREELVPACVDLLAVCLDAGLPLAEAVRQVAPAVGEPLRSDLAAVVALLDLGATPAVAWAGWRDPPGLAPVARAVLRSSHSGAALAASLRAVASEARAERTARGEAAVRRCAVLVLAPLGLCFLPAFVCLGVVPIVLGVAATVLP